MTPATSAPTRTARPVAPADPVPGVHVLVVDDDPAACATVRAALDDTAVVVGLPDTYQALAHLAWHRVDVIVLELFLPGAGGLELLRRLDRSVPVVVVTHAITAARVAHGVAAVLQKPAAPGALRATLEAVLAPAPAPVPIPSVDSPEPRRLRCVTT